MTTRTHRLCLECVFFNLSLGEPDYSEYTPGENPAIRCLAGHYSFDRDDFYPHYKVAILKARTCPDFEFESLEEEVKRGSSNDDD